MTVPSPSAELLTKDGKCLLNATKDPQWPGVARNLLASTRLVVLAGSGCSFGLQGGRGRAPMMGDLYRLVAALPGYDGVVAAHAELGGLRNVEELLSAVQALASLTAKPGIELDFLRASTEAIREACDFVDETTNLLSHETLLRKLARRETRQERANIFTTNYDLAIESALQRLRYTAIDGFGYGSRARFGGENFGLDVVTREANGELRLAPNVVRLMKLHGSVDWDEQPDGIRRSAAPENAVLVYPSANKYRQSYRQPYLEAMARFQAALREPETSLLVVGFGFADDHITAPVVDALLTQPTLRVLVVSPDALTSTVETYRRMREAVSAGDGRIALLSGTLSDLAQALPDQAGQDQWQSTQDAVSRIFSDR